MHRGIKSFGLLLTHLALVACSSGGADFENSQEARFKVNFGAFLGDPATQDHEQIEFKANSCSSNQSFSNIGSMNNDYEVNDLRFYLSGFTILLNDNTEVEWKLDTSRWQNEFVALIDLEDCSNPAMNREVTGSAFVPEASAISGFCFTLGLPTGFNHNLFSAASAPLDLTSLYLNRRDGYRFMRLDGVTNLAADASVNFNVHLASMSCDSHDEDTRPLAACSFENKPRVCVRDFDFESQQLALRVDRILVDTDISIDEATQEPENKGCMPSQADASCQNIIPRFGLDFVYQPTENLSTTYPKVDTSLDENKLFEAYTPLTP